MNYFLNSGLYCTKQADSPLGYFGQLLRGLKSLMMVVHPFLRFCGLKSSRNSSGVNGP